MPTQSLLTIMKTLLYRDIKRIQLAKVFPKLCLYENCSNLQLEPSSEGGIETMGMETMETNLLLI